MKDLPLIISLLWLFGIIECQLLGDVLTATYSSSSLEPASTTIETQYTKEDDIVQEVVISDCGGEFQSSSGTLNYYFENGTYPELSSCSWCIKTSFGTVVRITFTKLDTEQEYDFIKIKDNGEMLLKTSGDILPAQLISKTSKVLIEFTSDWVFSFRGFTLKWEETDLAIDSHVHALAECPPVSIPPTCPPPPAPVTCPPPAPNNCPTLQSIGRTLKCPPPPTPAPCPPCSQQALDRICPVCNDFPDIGSFMAGIGNQDTESSTCLQPWVMIDDTGECIKASTEVLTANEAEIACRNLGAHLIVPKDTYQLARKMKELQWIGDYYVGANDKDSPGQYHWHNGTPISQSAFWEDFPRDGDPGNSCVVINDIYGEGFLLASENTNCDTDKWRYICRKKLAPMLSKGNNFMGEIYSYLKPLFNFSNDGTTNE
ncbi:unnamed protein product [Meganyctiphanes norvegica]|uniref:Uncharacterized protein n=1 Tax=Meganyctiphanes norvegica TaxID=48144 RepID=A0AAV2RDB0_MEGNR